jgi:hypothetical protein
MHSTEVARALSHRKYQNALLVAWFAARADIGVLRRRKIGCNSGRLCHTGRKR